MDDVFHNVVMLEHSIQSQGFKEGFVKGKEEGAMEGFKLGWGKGSALGSEIGFYSGFCAKLLEECSKDDSKHRVCTVLQSILKMVDELKYDDLTNQQVFDQIEKIRGKFKHVTSLLKLSTNINDTAPEKGISF